MQAQAKTNNVILYFILGMALLTSGSSFAERLNGLKTWVAQDRSGVGMLHYDASASGRWGWTTNGNVFDCVRTGGDEANFRTTLYCPSINYTFYLSRHQMQISSVGGTVTYPGQWDDRRFWFYQSGAIRGQFKLKDRFVWEENQWRGNTLIATFRFAETSRDDNYIYIRDASRNISVAIGLTKVFVRVGNEAWRQFYTGTW